MGLCTSAAEYIAYMRRASAILWSLEAGASDLQTAHRFHVLSAQYIVFDRPCTYTATTGLPDSVNGTRGNSNTVIGFPRERSSRLDLDTLTAPYQSEDTG